MVGLAAGVLLSLLALGLHWPSEAVAFIAGAGVVVAVLTDRKAERWRREMREAESATRGMGRLYELTRRTLEMDLHVEPGPQLARLVQEIFDFEGVALFDADLHEVYEAGRWTTSPRELALNVYHFESSDDDRAKGISRRVVRLGAVPVGSLVVRGDSSPLANSAIAALVAVTFDRYRATANESRIEAERQTEQMRSTVLDNLAHAYKTPLTAIRAASSGLSEMGQLSAPQAGLVRLIDEQARMLSELTGKLLTTASLEAGGSGEGSSPFALHTSVESAASLIEDVVESLSEHSSAVRIAIEIPDPELELRCDRRLISMLLTQYLDNACKYADEDSRVTVRAAQSGEDILFSVHSLGPAIPVTDRERIFERYYRSANASRHATGTGIGLSIARRVAQAHGGAVWVSSDERQGTTFFAAIPNAGGSSAAENTGGNEHEMRPVKAGAGSTVSRRAGLQAAEPAAEFERSAP